MTPAQNATHKKLEMLICKTQLSSIVFFESHCTTMAEPDVPLGVV